MSTDEFIDLLHSKSMFSTTNLMFVWHDKGIYLYEDGDIDAKIEKAALELTQSLKELEMR